MLLKNSVLNRTPRCRCSAPPVARFSKVPKLFGRISDDIILFASAKRRRPETRNFAVISLPNKQVIIIEMAFRARKVLGTFEKQAPGHYVGYNKLVDGGYMRSKLRL